MTFTDPETIFVASACEYGVAVQGDVSMATSIMITGNRQYAPHVIPGHDPESVEHTAVTFTDPETIFVASACEYGVAVQGDISMVISIMVTDDKQNAATVIPGHDPESVKHTPCLLQTLKQVLGDVSMVTGNRRKNYFKACFKTSRFACIDLRYVAPPLTAFASVACIESITSMPRFLFLEFLFTVFAIF